MSETLFKEKAVHAYPNGWTCVQCGDEYSKQTVDVKDFYAINTDEGTLCLSCFELENSTLSCGNCGSFLIGEQPEIEFPYCAKCPTEDKLHEIIQWLTQDYYDLLPDNIQHQIDTQLNLMGFTEEYFKKLREKEGS